MSMRNGRRNWRSLAITASFSLLACGAPEIEPAELPSSAVALSGVPHTVTSGDLERRYTLYVPASVSSSSVKRPLLLMLHGYGGGNLASSSDMISKAEKEGFIVASLFGSPCDLTIAGAACHDADLDELGDELGWNTGITPGTGIVVDDVQYVRDVIADIDNFAPVNHRRIYAAGLSQGGMMTYRLAAEMSHELAAVGIVGSTIGLAYQCSEQCAATCAGDPSVNYACNFGTSCQRYRIAVPEDNRPISVAIVHGTADDHLYANGDVGVCPPGLDPATLRQAVNLWVAEDACDNPPLHFANADFERTRFFGCDQHSEVVLFVVQDLPHAWPSPSELPNSFSINDALWRVFSRHHL